ncbi:MAG TPA: glutamate--tRNA ligase [Holosporales bacterium]|nr:glutamate--tRNA ligase [Holosporales bacterium]
MKLRFAPSPTGNLHVGNARTLLLNWLYAKKKEAQFVLRFDDTDLERSKDEYAEQIKKDMVWLGLTYDSVVKQSDRLNLYQEAAEKLKKSGRLYPCYETKNELDFKRKRQLSQGRPPIYDRTALRLSADEIAAFEADGRRPHWRFQLEDVTISWQDAAHGELSFEAKHFSDPILIRENGAPVYTLSGVVDDLDLGITHIIRGDDHLSNTAIQIHLMEALGGDGKDFVFAHLPLLTGADGEGLSKRLGSLGLKDLKEENYEPMALVNYLGNLGNSEESDIALNLEAFIDSFDLSKFGKSSPKFSQEDLQRANGKFLQVVPFEQIKERLDALGFTKTTKDFWNTIQGNLTLLTDVKEYEDICFSTINPKIKEQDFIEQAKEILPKAPWDEETWGQWTSALKTQTGRKGKALFMPLRQALTAEDHGPEMKKLLPFIGYEKTLKRLNGQSE